MTELTYIGSELQLFEKATNWKAYWRDQLKPYIQGDVLEVGAGIGANTKSFIGGRHRSWTCLEPDATLCEQLRSTVANSDSFRVVTGVVGDLPSEDLFDTILYIDVLEHIPDDHAEMARAAARLRPGGHLLVLSPAHQWLFTPFDSAIGHYRRYSTSSLRATQPPGVTLVSLRYLDSVGMLASLGNKLLLKQSQPAEAQILMWDRCMVPISRYVDPLLAYKCGKTVIGIWRR